MAIFNGTAYILAIGGTTLPDQTEGSVSLSMETRDTSTKGSGGFRSIAEGMRSGSISVSGLVADDSDAVSTLMTSFSNRSVVAVVFGVDGTTTGEDDHNFSANGYVTSIEASASVEDNVTYSATIELTGTITFDGTDET